VNQDLERIGRKLAPHVLAALARHLESITEACESEVRFHHAPGGVARRCKTSIITPGLDVAAPLRAESEPDTPFPKSGLP
jgi:hypothetical protein